MAGERHKQVEPSNSKQEEPHSIQTEVYVPRLGHTARCGRGTKTSCTGSGCELHEH